MRIKQFDLKQLELISEELKTKKSGKFILSMDCFNRLCHCNKCGSYLEEPENGLCFNCGADDWNHEKQNKKKKLKGEITYPHSYYGRPYICTCSDREITQEEVDLTYHHNSGEVRVTGTVTCKKCGAKDYINDI